MRCTGFSPLIVQRGMLLEETEGGGSFLLGVCLLCGGYGREMWMLLCVEANNVVFVCVFLSAFVFVVVNACVFLLVDFCACMCHCVCLLACLCVRMKKRKNNVNY